MNFSYSGRRHSNMENIADYLNYQHCNTELSNDIYDISILLLVQHKLPLRISNEASNVCRHILYHHSLKK